MKKIRLVLFLLLFIFVITGCKDKTLQMENGVTMTLNEELKNSITMNANAPSLTFSFDGVFNVYETSSDLGYIFTNNDNLKLSSALENHLKQFKDSYYVTSELVQENDSPNAIFGDKKMPIDPNTNSVEYTLVVWDQNGTRYSYIFRSFLSGGVRYYAYSYATGITMSIEVPLLVQKVNGKQQIYMVALPYNTSYKLGANTKINSLLSREEYLEESYHTFDYPSAIAASSNKASDVQKWYIEHCNGRWEENNFIFDYLGIKYQVTFGENNFKIYVV